MSQSTRPILALYFFLVTSLAAQTSATGTASISGTVLGDDGKTLAAVITVIRSGARSGGHTSAGADGRFTISNLAPGTYSLCALVKTGGYLNPCAWSAALPTLNIAAGRAITGYRLVLKTGAVVQVRLNDSGGVLSPIAAPSGIKPHVLVGVVTARKLIEPFALLSKDAAGRNLQGTIPLNKPVVLEIAGKGVQISNQAGASLNPNGSTLSIQQPSGAPPQTVTFNITAGKP